MKVYFDAILPWIQNHSKKLNQTELAEKNRKQGEKRHIKNVEKLLREVDLISQSKTVEAHKIYYPNIYDKEGGIISGFLWSGLNPHLYHSYENGVLLDRKWFSLQVNCSTGNQLLFLTPIVGEVVTKSKLILFNGERNFSTCLNNLMIETSRGLESIEFDDQFNVIKENLANGFNAYMEVMICSLLVFKFLIFYMLFVN